MDIFVKYNQRNVRDRHVDTLIGLSKGLVADGKVNQAEAEFLMSWLIQNQHLDNPIIHNLLDKISSMFEDGILDEEESDELLVVLKSIGGEASEIGELAKSTTLPLCMPAPSLQFAERTFLFTGTCAFGSRKQCQEAIIELGGTVVSSVSKTLNYLVIGSYVTDSWAHESFGRKIEKALEYRSSGVSLHIISEAHWLSEAGL